MAEPKQDEPVAASNTTIEVQPDDNQDEPLLANSATASHFHYTWHDALKKIMYSKAYWVFCICMIIVCVGLLIWTIIQGGHPRQLWFVLLEGLVNVLLVAEVIFRMLLEGKVIDIIFFTNLFFRPISKLF